MNEEKRKRSTRVNNGAILPHTLAFAFLLLAFCVSVTSLQAQEPAADDIAPPPLKFLSKEEKSQLEALPDVKKRTKLALELMGIRLKRAEEMHSKQEFEPMFLELGRFHALIDNTLDFLNRNNNDSGKVLNNYKRLEIGLRTFTPRLELIRRDLPLRFEFYVRNLTRYLRDARSKAVESLFSDTVVPNKKPE